MALAETFADKLLQRENVSAVRRLIIGGLLAAATPLGWPYIAAMGIGCIGLNAVVMTHEKTIQHKKLLNFYEDEISTLLHKPVNSLTIDDLKQVAKPVSQGGKGIATLQKELEELNTRQKFRIGSSTTSSLITTGILIAISVAFPAFLSGGLSMVLGLGLIGFGYTAIALTVKAAVQTMFGTHDTEDMVNQRLMRIGEAIKERPAHAIEIFGLFVDANPDLAKQIKQNFKSNYADLPVIQKKQVVEAYEPEFRVIGLTDAMNKGTSKPSLVGLIASADASDALPGYSRYRTLFDAPLQKISDQSFEFAGHNVNLSEHRKRIIAERQMPGSNTLQ